MKALHDPKRHPATSALFREHDSTPDRLALILLRDPPLLHVRWP
jgi:hypothetical protein